MSLNFTVKSYKVAKFGALICFLHKRYPPGCLFRAKTILPAPHTEYKCIPHLRKKFHFHLDRWISQFRFGSILLHSRVPEPHSLRLCDCRCLRLFIGDGRPAGEVGFFISNIVCDFTDSNACGELRRPLIASHTDVAFQSLQILFRPCDNGNGKWRSSTLNNHDERKAEGVLNLLAESLSTFGAGCNTKMFKDLGGFLCKFDALWVEPVVTAAQANTRCY